MFPDYNHPFLFFPCASLAHRLARKKSLRTALRAPCAKILLIRERFFNVFTKGTSFLKRREDAKIAKYTDPCTLEGWDFLPMAFSTWGSTGPQAYTLLRKILRRAAMGTDADSRSARLADMSNRLSLALFRQILSLLQPIHLL